jgi:FXSXX-COOH protein
MKDRPHGGTEPTLRNPAPREPAARGEAAPQPPASEAPTTAPGALTPASEAPMPAPARPGPAERDCAPPAPAASGQAPGALDERAPAEAGIDLLGMDLESLRTVEHPVLSALVSDLRERAAVTGGEALWGFESDGAAPEPTR